MAKGATFDNALLNLLFNNSSIAPASSIGSGLVAATTAGSLYVALHTAAPATDNQTSNETAYTGYARVAVARSSGGWTITGASVSPTATISFPACTGGTSTITNFSIGVASSGSSLILYTGTVTPNISVSSGVTPQLTTSSTVTES